jgi:hypothetical protein
MCIDSYARGKTSDALTIAKAPSLEALPPMNPFACTKMQPVVVFNPKSSGSTVRSSHDYPSTGSEGKFTFVTVREW